MRRFILDTSILVHYIRGTALYQAIEANENITAPDSLPLISVVSIGELMSFSIQRNWGQEKQKKLKSIVSKLYVLDMHAMDEKLLNAYAEIDSFSKNKLAHRKHGQSISMGKNDLWIAATAKAAGATLLILDADFDHLNGVFISVKRY